MPNDDTMQVRILQQLIDLRETLKRIALALEI
jgi:hypothetical protein